MDKNSLDLMRELKLATRGAGINDVRVQKSGCLDYCEYGPTCVIYPQGEWFCITKESIQPLVNYLGGGKIPSEFSLDLKVLQDE
jgi:(2Fe-2S) ferredoxin